jgi:hypothetical protein
MEAMKRSSLFSILLFIVAHMTLKLSLAFFCRANPLKYLISMKTTTLLTYRLD